MNYYERRTARTAASLARRRALAAATCGADRHAAQQEYYDDIQTINAAYRPRVCKQKSQASQAQRRTHIKAQNAEVCALLGDVPSEVILAVTDDPAE